MLSGMHEVSRVPGMVAELGGLQDDDLDRLSRAMSRYVGWVQSCFADETVPMPLGDIVAGFLAYTKLRGLDARTRVLEIGPGYGFMGLFFCEDKDVKTYDMIEITQSLYII